MERDVPFLYVCIEYVCTNRMLIGKYDKLDILYTFYKNQLVVVVFYLADVAIKYIHTLYNIHTLNSYFKQ
jgi:hypothetical protein